MPPTVPHSPDTSTAETNQDMDQIDCNHVRELYCSLQLHHGRLVDQFFANCCEAKDRVLLRVSASRQWGHQPPHPRHCLWLQLLPQDKLPLDLTPKTRRNPWYPVKKLFLLLYTIYFVHYLFRKLRWKTKIFAHRYICTPKLETCKFNYLFYHNPLKNNT